MFDLIVDDYIQARRAAIDGVQAKLLDAFDRMAKEVSISYDLAAHSLS